MIVAHPDEQCFLLLPAERTVATCWCRHDCHIAYRKFRFPRQLFREGGSTNDRPSQKHRPVPGRRHSATRSKPTEEITSCPLLQRTRGALRLVLSSNPNSYSRTVRNDLCTVPSRIRPESPAPHDHGHRSVVGLGHRNGRPVVRGRCPIGVESWHGCRECRLGSR
jgi:hypothetical protein